MAHLCLILGSVYAAVGVLVAAVCIPLALGKVKPNRWYGVRLPQSKNSDEAWYAINRFGAKWLIGWAIVLIMIGVGVILYPLPKPQVIVPFIMFVSVLIIVPLTAVWRYAMKFDK